MSVSTHVLDSVTGQPASGMPVSLLRRVDDGWLTIADARTDADGRVTRLVADSPAGVYRLCFAVDDYAEYVAFFPEVVVTFRITDPGAHHHVPLLLSTFAYSTYRGS